MLDGVAGKAFFSEGIGRVGKDADCTKVTKVVLRATGIQGHGSSPVSLGAPWTCVWETSPLGGTTWTVEWVKIGVFLVELREVDRKECGERVWEWHSFSRAD